MNKTIKKELILLKDLGMKFPTEKSVKKYRYGLYQCFCGKEFESVMYDVKRNKIKSCGCMIGKNNFKHSRTYHRLYHIWYNMMQRCSNQNIKSYKDYGGRGIIVCDRWLDINNFIEDMYPSFEEGLTLDRKDVNGNYEKDNCRWATNLLQSQNKRLLQSNNKSGYRGVSYFKRDDKWKAQIKNNNIVINLGCFKTAIEAARVRDKYIIDNNLEHTLNFKKGN